jgi:hypothetical protein
MSTVSQFNKGEAIKITVVDDDGSMLEGEYKADGTIGSSSSEQVYAGLRTYPDDLNLETGDTTKIKHFTTASSGDTAGKLFTLEGNFTKGMDEGQYTLELIYGKGDDNRVIVKANHAFNLVGTAYKLETTQQG